MTDKRSVQRRKTAPDLEIKKQPAQKRATETYEQILAVTAELLADVGVERLSTNMVCERAGLTPPALYRYFPNKYALLNELGQRLMQSQNEVIPKWINPEALSGGIEEIEAALEGLILDTYRVTKRMPGGMWIMRALRAVPTLQEVRLSSHEEVTRLQVKLLAQLFPEASRQELALVARVAVDMMYAAVELMFESRLSPRPVARTVACMVASHVERIRLDRERSA